VNNDSDMRRCTLPIPDVIKIGPYNVSVLSDTDVMDLLDTVRGDQMLGLCTPDRASIFLRPGRDDMVMRQTLLHESLHMMCYTANLGLPAEQEESVVEKLATLLLQVLRDNEEFVEWLCE
jgi:hypothetical protein